MTSIRYLVLLAAVATSAPVTGQAPALSSPPRVVTHDNLKSAGQVQGGELRVALWAGVGTWTPVANTTPALEVRAFGEEGGPLSIPSPLIRAAAGTVVRAAIRNTLTTPLRLRGFCDRPGACDPLVIAPGGRHEVRFTLASDGLFHYWAETTGTRLPDRTGIDSQLGGAIVVDPPGPVVPDRVFVMGLRGGAAVPSPPVTVINGRSWPDTERLHYTTGDTARWRVINLTSAPHAMHLHGFYFQVDSVGDGVRDTRYADADRRWGVTEQMPPGRTMTMTWVPQRPGNWLFHCHMLVHMMTPDEHHGGVAATDALGPSAGMAGLVLGIHVTGPDRSAPPADRPRRTLRFVVEPDARHGATPSYKVSITDGTTPAPRLNDRAVPGPVMVLTRGEPVAVDVVNRLANPTAIHWHGIELESYDDGVPGFGGTSVSVTPPVAPGSTFTARFTPPRAGTFIYHTHWHDVGQLAGGIYGPLIVLEPGQRYDPSADHIVVLGLDGAHLPAPDEPFAVNGDAAPRPLDLKAGVANRIRFMNITADNVALTVQLLSGFDPVQWTPLAKDGFDNPASQRTPRAARQLVSVGETYDFELPPMPPTPLGLWMELRRGNGELLRQWAVRVR